MELSREGGGKIKLQTRRIPCSSREAVVTVMSYKNGIMTGCLQHPRLDGKKEFHSLSQMVLLLDGLMDLESCPNPPPPFIFPEYDGGEKEEIFRIQILFREHYTWQGRLVWQRENREYVFHSAIELIQLFDEMLAG